VARLAGPRCRRDGGDPVPAQLRALGAHLRRHAGARLHRHLPALPRARPDHRRVEGRCAADRRPGGLRAGRAAVAAAAMTALDRPADEARWLDVEPLLYRYPAGAQALRGIDLVVARGEKVALIGPNGAAKSTLMLHRIGLLAP